MESKRILVTGATGYVGSRLVATLLDDGHEVVAATRNPEKLGRFGWCDRVTAVVLDAGDPTSIETAFAVAGPIDAIYYLVHAIGQPGFRQRDNAAAAGEVRAGLPVRDLLPRGVVGRVAGAAVPVPTGLAADLIESLDHPMTASDTVLRDHVPDPPGGLATISDAVAAAVSSPRPRPVDRLADPHHLADSDPVWAGGDALRLRRVAATVTPGVARRALGLFNAVPGPVAGALRTGLDLVLARVRFL